MHYIPCTKSQEKEILHSIGVSSFDELLNVIPDELRIKSEIGLPESVSEFDIDTLLSKIANQNIDAMDNLCFSGGGVYDHYVPKVIDAITNRSEFYTAYTPYQAEVSQGTLQYLYEFQSMICELSGMDAANASLYDGASALAEACSLALSSSNNTIIAISETVNPNYINVVKTYLQNRNVRIIKIPSINGISDLSLINQYSNDLAALVIQSPNYFGQLESWESAKELLVNSKSLLIAVSDPVSLSIITSPGDSGADVYVGEGQSLGNYMSYGGPNLGLIAVKSNYVRNMPGRIIGKTVDRKGRPGFVLTLQTREQHIRRERATSNICTNQGLMALRSTIFMSLMGKEGLSKLAELCFKKTQYAAKRINSLRDYSVLYSDSFIKEIVIKCKTSAKKIKNMAENNGIFLNTVIADQTDRLLLIAITEKRSKNEIDYLVEFFKSIN